MRGTDSLKLRRAFAGIMTVMMLAVVLFSAFHIALESEHDCCGDDCAFCASLHGCRRLLLLTVEARGALFAIAIVFAAFLAFSFPLLNCASTPVSKKVRLNS